MPSYLAPLIQKYSKNGIFLDTNVFLLFTVGIFNREFISRFKRVSAYEARDFDFLQEFVSRFYKIIITPHILTEMSNLSFEIKDRMFKDYFNKFVVVLKDSIENYTSKDELINHRAVEYLGFPDISIIETSKKIDCLVLTDDARLFNEIMCNGRDVVNFNHLRQHIIWNI